MKVIRSGASWPYGWHWWIRVGKKAGINIEFDFTHIMFGAGFVYNEEAKWITLSLGLIDITYFFEPDWE